MSEENLLGYECKHISYSTDKAKKNDFVLIKEVVHTKDGKQIPRLRMYENFKRPIYITREQHRNHQEKKEYEDLSKVQKWMTSDIEMAKMIQHGLGYRFPDPKRSLKQVCKSPYVYWADLKVTTYIKERYMRKWSNLTSFNRIAILDIETNEMQGTKEPLIVGVVCDNQIHLAMPRWYEEHCKGTDTINAKCHDLLSKVPFTDKKKGEYTKDLIKDYEIHYHVYETVGYAIKALMTAVHAMLPDFLVIWNMDFDITKILDQLKAEGIPPEDVFCHPDVPEQYRNVWYKRDEAKKKTESKTLTKAPADQWHVLYCQASFYVIDAMSLFKKIRTHEGNRPSYKLSSILGGEVGVGKMDIPGLEYNDNLDWHVDAQKQFPAEYCAYNIMDDLLIKELDKKTADLASAVTILSGISMFDIFPSLPKRICDAYTYFLLDDNKVIGCVGADIKNSFDEEVIGTTGWIVTLAAHMNAENGLHCIAESATMKTAFRGQVADADLTQAYPSATNMLNQSRETTCIELIDIEGVPEAARRRAGINLTAGKVNAMEIANEMFLLPEKDTMLEAYLRAKGESTGVSTIKVEAAANEEPYLEEKKERVA